MFNKLAIIILIAAGMFLTGCGIKYKTSNIVPNNLPNYGESVCGNIKDIKVTSRVDGQFQSIDKEDFAKGLSNSISSSGIQKKCNKDYIINADITKFDYPAVAADIYVIFGVSYSIVDGKDNNLISKKDIETKGNSPLSEGGNAGVRFARAMERAVAIQFVEFLDYYYRSLSK
jgi:hypothetical protein